MINTESFVKALNAYLCGTWARLLQATARTVYVYARMSTYAVSDVLMKKWLQPFLICCWERRKKQLCANLIVTGPGNIVLRQKLKPVGQCSNKTLNDVTFLQIQRSKIKTVREDL